MTAFPKPSPRKGKKAPRKNPRKTLVNKLDRAFSRWVRQRDGDTCVTCGKNAGRDLVLIDCGHFVSRRCFKLRWDPSNAHSQCAFCNRFNAGAGAAYAAFIVRKYGQAELLRLDRESRVTWKPTLEELRALLTRFQGETRE